MLVCGSVSLPAVEIRKSHTHHEKGLAGCEQKHFAARAQVQALAIVFHQAIPDEGTDIPDGPVKNFRFVHWLNLLFLMGPDGGRTCGKLLLF